MPCSPPLMLASAAVQWLRHRRSRCIFLLLLLCSPILLPFLCLVAAAELCSRLLCGRRSRRKEAREDSEDERLRRCEEGGCAEEEEEEVGEGEEIGLLQRYLEDQLLLVGSVYECGESDDGDDGEFLDRRHARAPLLS